MQIGAAYVGVDTFSFGRAALMTMLNTFSAHILLPFCVTAVVANTLFWGRSDSEQTAGSDAVRQRREHATAALTLLIFALFSTRALLTFLNSIIQRRHLMLWAIFAPKYIFDVCGMLSYSLSSLFVSILHHGVH